MRITSKTKYALLALGEFKEKDKTVSIRELSEKYLISRKYLERIFCDLETCGIVKGKRGPKGGYSLTRKSEQLTLKDIIMCLEKRIDVIHCEDLKKECIYKKNCYIYPVWDNLNNIINEYLSSITLEKLLIGGKNECKD
jgi:Rrf2 family iron-sulfur cluster assembly transcriptional regulator